MIAWRSLRISSNSARARMVMLPRPVSNASRMPERPRMMPPVGKSGPGTMRISSSSGVSGLAISARVASMISPGLCGGMLVAMPTAMPLPPLISRLGKLAGRTFGSLSDLVVVRLEVDRVLVDIVQQQGGGAGQPHLGVAHRRRVIAVHRAEIALPVDQRHAHGEGLRHADQGVVDRGVAVRVILTHDVADDAGRFAIRPCPAV